MTRRVFLVLVVACALVLTASSVQAQIDRQPAKGMRQVIAPVAGDFELHPGIRGPRPEGPAIAPAKPPMSPALQASPITGLMGYHAGFQTGAYYPEGVATSFRGDRFYFTQDGDCDVTMFKNRVFKDWRHVDYYLTSCRMAGALYIGTDHGVIWKIPEGGVPEVVGWDHWGDYVDAVDVDPATGDIYFLTEWYGYNYFYKIPAHAAVGEAEGLDYWGGEMCYGLAVKGNRIYVASYDYDCIWYYEKNSGDWWRAIEGLNGPTDVDFDRLGNMYIAEWDSGTIAMVKEGRTSAGRIAAGFSTPWRLQVDGTGQIFVADYYGWGIWKLFK